MNEQCSEFQSQFSTDPFVRFVCVIILSIWAAIAIGTESYSGKLNNKPILKIQEVKSPAGIAAWLVENHSLSFFTLSFSFEGGSAQDPPNQLGVSNFLSHMLDQGAGELDASAFQRRKDDIAMRLSFDSHRERFTGRLETLTEHRDKAVELLRLALNKPRFDRSAMERAVEQILAQMADDATDPDNVASKTWNAVAFPGHPYGRPDIGTEESVRRISALELSKYHKRIFARSGLNIVAVGDIDAATLKPLLDRLFGALPPEQGLIPVEKVTVSKAAKITVVRMPVEQSVVLLGLQGIKRADPDFMAADVMNRIIGGKNDSARLWTEIRGKRGLAYLPFSLLKSDSKTPTFMTTVTTRNKNVAQVINLIRKEMRHMAREGVSTTELANAKDYLTGSFALKFDTNANIADMLLGIQEQKLGIDYLNSRNAKISAVSLQDINRVAERLLKVNELQIVVVGEHNESEIFK